MNCIYIFDKKLITLKIKIMNKNLGLLIAQGFDLDLFWHIGIKSDEVTLYGDNTAKIQKYLLSKGFEKYDYLYENDKTKAEFKKDNIRVALLPK